MFQFLSKKTLAAGRTSKFLPFILRGTGNFLLTIWTMNDHFIHKFTPSIDVYLAFG